MDDDQIILHLAEHDGSKFRGGIWLDDIDEGALLAHLDCAGGDEQCVFLDSENQPYEDELAGPEVTVFIGQCRAQFDDAGAVLNGVVEE